MTRHTYDVAEPGPRPVDQADDPPPDQPACPLCGGGPPVLVPALRADVCKSCARIVRRR